MELNATLLGQMITFAIFVWFTMRVVWPLLDGPLEERKKRIADGLAQAEQGSKILEDAQSQVEQKIATAKSECQTLLADANLEATRILEAARMQALRERDAILAAGHTSIDLALARAKIDLQGELANIVVMGAEKILARSINQDDHRELLDSLAKSL